MTTTATTTTTRHAARCQTDGCSRFCGESGRCQLCEDRWTAGFSSRDAVVNGLCLNMDRVTKERDAAREAAVKDHAAHQAEIEAQARKADAVIAEQRTVITETRAEVEDLKAGEKDMTEALALANENLDDSAKRNASLLKDRDDLRAEVTAAREERDGYHTAWTSAATARDAQAALVAQAGVIIAERDREIEQLARREANTDLLCEQLAARTRERDAAMMQRDVAIEQGDRYAKDAERLGQRNTRLGMVAFFAVIAAIGVMARYGALAALAAAMGWGR